MHNVHQIKNVTLVSVTGSQLRLISNLLDYPIKLVSIIEKTHQHIDIDCVLFHLMMTDR